MFIFSLRLFDVGLATTVRGLSVEAFVTVAHLITIYYMESVSEFMLLFAASYGLGEEIDIGDGYYHGGAACDGTVGTGCTTVSS